MSIKEFIEKAAGNWVSPKNCQVNDVLLIKTAPVMDTTSFQGKTYLVMDVINERLGANQVLKLRIGGQQAKNLEAFGDQASSWVNRRVRIVAKLNYSGLNKEGFIYAPA